MEKLTDQEEKILLKKLETITDVKELLAYKSAFLKRSENEETALKQKLLDDKESKKAEANKKYRHGVFVILGLLWKYKKDFVIKEIGETMTKEKFSEFDARCIEQFFSAKGQNFKVPQNATIAKVKKSGFGSKAKAAEGKKLQAEKLIAYYKLCETIKTANDPKIFDALKMEIELGMKKSVFDVFQSKEKKPKKAAEKKAETPKNG